MTTISAPLCFKCKHYQGYNEIDEDTSEHICAAFPDGIPIGIIFSVVSHKKHFPGDNGIQFEPK